MCREQEQIIQKLDLTEVRCPLALVLLKQQLNKLSSGQQLELLFSNTAAMQDIQLYLDKKQFYYVVHKDVITMTY